MLNDEQQADDDKPVPRVANLKTGIGGADPDHYNDPPYPQTWRYNQSSE